MGGNRRNYALSSWLLALGSWLLALSSWLLAVGFSIPRDSAAIPLRFRRFGKFLGSMKFARAQVFVDDAQHTLRVVLKYLRGAHGRIIKRKPLARRRNPDSLKAEAVGRDREVVVEDLHVN